MILFAVLLFLIVLVLSGLLYWFCKRLIYKLNKRVLIRNMAILKNTNTVKSFSDLSEEEIREKLISSFFMVLGYNTYDYREFERVVNRVNFYADYIVKKWYNSRLCKKPLYIKYAPFPDSAVDLKNSVYNDTPESGCKLDELMDKLYFQGEYFVLTNGVQFLFFDKKRIRCLNKFILCFDLRNFTKEDAAKLANFTKQCLFLEISDVYSR